MAFCVFEASSSRTVEEAYERAHVRFERVIDALEVEVVTRVSGPRHSSTTSPRQEEAP